MVLTEVQNKIYEQIALHVKATPSYQIVYCSEWLGWLPDGVYHWINDCNGKDITEHFPKGWTSSDIQALEKEGLLIKISERQNSNDEFDHEITYQVILPKH